MVHKAVLVGPQRMTLVCANSEDLVPGDESFCYEAPLAALVLARKKDVKDGVMFMDACPSLNCAKALVSAELGQVVYAKPPESEDETAALQLLEQYNIPALFNSEIIM